MSHKSTQPGVTGPTLRAASYVPDLNANWWEDLKEDRFLKLHLKQACKEKEDVDFEAGYFVITCSKDKIYVFSDFSDSDIFNPATYFNDPKRPKGDYAELLIKPCFGKEYYEFHVTPQNINSQYLFHYAYEINDLRKSHPDKSASELCACAGKFYEAYTHIDPLKNHWAALMVIDLPSLTKDRSICPNYFLNLCRRNCFQNSEAEQHSSILALSEFNYHHQNEWAKLTIS